jgi:hypothetical protein
MAWPQETKLESLPITETEFGFVQSCRWQHLDRGHEEVIEIDVALDIKVPTDVKVIYITCSSYLRHRFIHSF